MDHVQRVVLDLYSLEIDSIAFFSPDIARLGDLSAVFLIDTGKQHNRPAPVGKKIADHQAYPVVGSCTCRREQVAERPNAWQTEWTAVCAELGLGKFLSALLQPNRGPTVP